MKITMKIFCVFGILGMASVVSGAPSGGQTPGSLQQRPVVVQPAVVPILACPKLSAKDQATWDYIIAPVAAQVFGSDASDPFSCNIYGDDEKKKHALRHWHLMLGIEVQSINQINAVLSTFANGNCDDSYQFQVPLMTKCGSVDTLPQIVSCSLASIKAIGESRDIIKGMMEKLVECTEEHGQPNY